MAAAFEQIWYTWARRGVEGYNKAQVRATTAGLADPHAPLTAAARRLCRYDRPASGLDPAMAPVAFGWVDAQGYRFVFRRCATPPGPEGQRAAFAAHVLVAPVAACPLRDVARLWKAERIWFDLDRPIDIVPTRLDPLPLADVPTGLEVEAPDGAALEAFVAALLDARSDGRTLALALATKDMLSLVVAAVDRLPAPLLQGVSLSTYEPESTQGWFDIAGTFPHATKAPAELLATTLGDATDRARRASKAILASPWSASGRRRIDTALARVEEAGPAGVGHFLAVHDALDQLASGEEVEVNRLVAALRLPTGAAEICDSPAGRSAVAGALARIDPAVTSAFSSSLAILHTDQLQAIGVSTGEQVDLDSGQLVPTLECLAGLSAALEAGCLSTVLRRLETEPDRVPRLGSPALRRLVREPMSAPLADRVTGALGGPESRPLLTDQRVPTGRRARIAVDYLERTGDVATVTDAVRTDPGFAGAIAAAQPPPDALARVIAALGPASMATATAREVAASQELTIIDRASVMAQVAESFDLAGRVHLLAGIAADARGAAVLQAGLLPDLATGAAQESIEWAVAASSEPITIDQRLVPVLGAVNSGPARAWFRVLTACIRMPQASRQQLWREVDDSVRFAKQFDGRHAGLAADLVFDHACRTSVARELTSFERLAKQVAVLDVGPTAPIAGLRRPLVTGARNHSGALATLAVLHVAREISNNPPDVKPRELATALAPHGNACVARISHWQLEEVRPWFHPDQIGKAGWKWLESVGVRWADDTPRSRAALAKPMAWLRGKH